jgi:hypothetical protein
MFLERLLRKREENEIKFQKKTSKSSCQLEIEVVVLHPLRETHNVS